MIYENERRSFVPPFDWGTNSLLAAERKRFSDEEGVHQASFNSLDAAQSPSGFEWETDWKVDRSYTQTDKQGWCYAVDFNAIMSNFRCGKSLTSPMLHSVRRKKWVRMARPVHSIHKINGMIGKKEISRASIHANFMLGMSWRKEELNVNPNSILGSCKEKSDRQKSIVVPWTQVSSVAVVTSTVLSIFMKVHRYVGENEEHKDKFREVDMVLFVSNCPAVGLKGLVEERLMLAHTRHDIVAVIAAGKLSGVNNDESEAESEGGGIPETEELSLGSATIASLDRTAMMLEGQSKHLDELYAESGLSDQSILLEKAVIIRRACRLRLYIAALLSANLQGTHSFDTLSVNAVMHRDFLQAKYIMQDNNVETANNCIEYLLDTAEVRLRDSALCGWAHRGGALEKTLALFVNGYFIQMVGTLGAFFEGKNMQTIVGLDSKIKLITTYMKHNDRLDLLLKSALRPYGLKADPEPRLSYFLQLDTLIAWYSVVLQNEMKNVVDKALAVSASNNSIYLFIFASLF